jgi:hypothetical protein
LQDSEPNSLGRLVNTILPRILKRKRAAAPANDFTVEQVTQGDLYPKAEVNQCLTDYTELEETTGVGEGQAIQQIAEAVDTSDVLKIGAGNRVVYAYGYQCAPNRLKIGLIEGEGDTVQRRRSGRANPISQP